MTDLTKNETIDASVENDQEEGYQEDYDDYDDYDDYLDDELNDTDLWDNATGGKLMLETMHLRLLIHEQILQSNTTSFVNKLHLLHRAINQHLLSIKKLHLPLFTAKMPPLLAKKAMPTIKSKCWKVKLIV